LGRRSGGFDSSGIFHNLLLPRNASGSDGILGATRSQRSKPAVDGLVILNWPTSREHSAFPCGRCSRSKFKNNQGGLGALEANTDDHGELLVRKSCPQSERPFIHNPPGAGRLWAVRSNRV